MTLREALTRAVHAHGRDGVELEFRMGHRVGKAFVPGVPEPRWIALKEALDRSGKFGLVESEVTELFHDGGNKYVMPRSGPAHWMRKTRLFDADVDASGPWSYRASLSLERRLGEMPPPASHKFHRHKTRWSYRYACWSVDLTKVVSNLNVDSDGVSFEVEIELVDTRELFVRPMDAILEWGAVLCQDMCRLLEAREGRVGTEG